MRIHSYPKSKLSHDVNRKLASNDPLIIPYGHLKYLPFYWLKPIVSLNIQKSAHIGHNGLHMACGGFEALYCPPKPRLATKRKPCWQPFTRHKLYALLWCVFSFFIFPYPFPSFFWQPSLSRLFSNINNENVVI